MGIFPALKVYLPVNTAKDKERRERIANETVIKRKQRVSPSFETPEAIQCSEGANNGRV